MTLLRWEPRRDIENANRRFRQIMAEFENGLQNGINLEVGTYMPRVDISEGEKEVFVHAELPGMKQEEVKVTISEGLLTIRGEKKREEKHSKNDFHRIERSFGEFVRQFTLPENLDEEAASADFENGVLTIAIPRKAPAKPKEREVPIGQAKTEPKPEGNQSFSAN